MLAVISDLHLSDGTTSYNVSPQAFDLLGDEIAGNAAKNEAQEIHLVLLGDIFDLVRTAWWFDPENIRKEDRPWYHIDRRTGLNTEPKKVEQQFAAVLQGVLRNESTRGFVRMVNRLPAVSGGERPRLTYVIGNHDRALNNFVSLQQLIADQFPGLAVTFANSFTDPAYGVLARHGHEWDENCSARLLLKKVLQPGKSWDYLDPAIQQVMAIGEVITAELMSGLVHSITSRAEAKPGLVEILKGVDNLRPATDVFQWLQWQMRGAELTGVEQKILIRALVNAISGVVDSDLGKLWDKVQADLLVAGDIVDRLQFIRSRLKASGLDGLRECVKLFTTVGSFTSAIFPQQDPYYSAAKAEIEGQGNEFQFILYGHTHRARHAYFSGAVDGRVRMYINTGTYLPLVERTDDQTGFAKSHQMTMAFFYREGEDAKGKAGGGPTIDLWNGIKRKEYA